MHFDDYGCRLETLSPRALNRATLQRQHLIAPTDMTPASMIEHLVGMQAQNPLDPYFGLWARLDGFDSATLAAMVTDRKVVRGSFMRGTIHLFTAEDAMAVHPVTRTVPRGSFARPRSSRTSPGSTSMRCWARRVPCSTKDL